MTLIPFAHLRAGFGLAGGLPQVFDAIPGCIDKVAIRIVGCRALVGFELGPMLFDEELGSREGEQQKRMLAHERFAWLGLSPAHILEGHSENGKSIRAWTPRPLTLRNRSTDRKGHPCKEKPLHDADRGSYANNKNNQ